MGIIKKKSLLFSIAIMLVLILFIPVSADKSENETVIDKFNQIYYNSYIWDQTYWLGEHILQNPCDNHIVQEIIYDVKPDYIIEAGTFKGGSALYYACVLAQINTKGKIFTIDINPQVAHVSKFKIFKKYVKVFKGSSTSEEIYSYIAKKVKGKKVLVILDSAHTKDHVLQEMNLYSKLVSSGSYLIVADTNINGHPVRTEFGPGPMEAVNEFLSKNNDFEIDRSKEKLLLTFYPSGYLRKK